MWILTAAVMASLIGLIALSVAATAVACMGDELLENRVIPLPESAGCAKKGLHRFDEGLLLCGLSAVAPGEVNGFQAG